MKKGCVISNSYRKIATIGLGICKKLTLLFLIFTPICSAVDFNDQVLPLLQNRCFPCHDTQTRTSGFSVENIETVLAGGAQHGRSVNPGKPKESPLLKLLRGEIKPQMPMGKSLTADELKLVETWILSLSPEMKQLKNQGKYWAYVKPDSHQPPAVKDTAWTYNEIDNFILRELEKKALSPAPQAHRRTLIRRVFFDLLGIPPDPEEVNFFVNNSSLSAYEELVDQLLSDPRYGEHWGRYWLDLARYADTNGYEGDPEYFHTWRYRDYVIDAFNDDKPYDLFIKEQLAGDEFFEMMNAGSLPPPEPEKVVALSLLRLAPFTEPRGEEDRHILLSEMTSTVGSVFLGLTVGCAQCHDHKYDLFPIRDFYRLKAFFATVQIDPPRAGDIQQLGGPQPASFFKPTQKRRLDRERLEFEERLKVTQTAFEKFCEPLLKKLKTSDPNVNKLKRLTIKDLRKAIKVDQNYEKFTFKEHEQFWNYFHRVLKIKNNIERRKPLAFSLRNADGPPYGPNVTTTYVLERGHWNRRGNSVEPGFPSAITGHSKPANIELDPFRRYPTRGRRLALARWIANPDNPLTARVIVNRLWQQHFSRGIVQTPSDFGRNGSPPSHPELLDWLANQLIAKNWSLKTIHRLILTSSTYKQSSSHKNSQASNLDPQNKLLWRFHRIRLKGESIRDSILKVSQRLSSDRGGPPVFPPLPKGLDEQQKVQGTNTWETTLGTEGRKRSIYTFQRRSLNMPLLETFDAPVLNSSCSQRETSVSALQALTMYDGEFVNTEAQYFANRVRRESSSDLQSQIKRAFQIALGRNPQNIEIEKSLDLLHSNGTADSLVSLCRVLFNSNEFIYID